jgi:arylsulfatase A-like enzyme
VTVQYVSGLAFQEGATVRTPASNVDLAPTLLSLIILDKDANLDKNAVEAGSDRVLNKRSPMAPTRSKYRQSPHAVR